MAPIGSCFLAIDAVTLDCRGEKCPLPVLRMEKLLAGLPAGAALTVLATDGMARIDIPLYCTQNGHTLSQSEAEGVLRFDIVKAG